MSHNPADVQIQHENEATPTSYTIYRTETWCWEENQLENFSSSASAQCTYLRS